MHVIRHHHGLVHAPTGGYGQFSPRGKNHRGDAGRGARGETFAAVEVFFAGGEILALERRERRRRGSVAARLAWISRTRSSTPAGNDPAQRIVMK
jgi:hypothetical protein